MGSGIDPRGPIFISYRTDDGAELAHDLNWTLRTHGLPVWQDLESLDAGPVRRNLDRALRSGLSGAVVIVTAGIRDSRWVREVEWPELQRLSTHAGFSLILAVVPDAATTDQSELQVIANERLNPSKQSQDSKESHAADEQSTIFGEDESVTCLPLRLGSTHDRFAIAKRFLDTRLRNVQDSQSVNSLSLDVQSRTWGSPKDEVTLQLRTKPPRGDGRLPDPLVWEEVVGAFPAVAEGLAAHVDPTTIEVSGGMHLTMAFALGTVLSAPKFPAMVVRPTVEANDDRPFSASPFELVVKEEGEPRAGALREVFVDLLTFGGLSAELGSDASEARLLIGPKVRGRINPDDYPRLVDEIVTEIRGRGLTEISLYLAVPFPMAVQLGRQLTMVTSTVYELEVSPAGRRYLPTVRTRPATGNPLQVVESSDTSNRTLVLIETSGNQSYIFDTRTRRDQIGASQLVHESTTKWLEDALDGIEGDPKTLVSISGSAIVELPDAQSGRRLITALTTRALREAPGLQLEGRISDPIPDDEDLRSHVRALRSEFQTERLGPLRTPLRFQRLPIVAECQSTGGPASGFLSLTNATAGNQEEAYPVSVSVMAKRSAWKRGSGRLGQACEVDGIQPDEQTLLAVARHLADEPNWVAVIHADGNGVGQLLQGVGATDSGGHDNEVYRHELQHVSKALDSATKTALAKALSVVPTKEIATTANNKVLARPFLPIVVGGDDLTALCDGEYALAFAAAYLKAFEEETRRSTVLSKLAQGTTGSAFLTASAGVAIVKPHFPHAVAYELAEALTAEAKRAKTLDGTDGSKVPLSTLDFHVLHDSNHVQLDELRERTDRESHRLTGKPYVVTPLDVLGRLTDQAHSWAAAHHWDALVDQVGALNQEDDDGRRLVPSSQVQRLRTETEADVTMGEQHFKRLTRRYGDSVGQLGYGSGEDRQLFRTEIDELSSNKSVEVTSALDALEILDLFKRAVDAGSRR